VTDRIDTALLSAALVLALGLLCVLLFVLLNLRK
jgi:hypothetical protein